MWSGLKTLLEAAQFVEQQEKTKSSPQAATSPIFFNEQRFLSCDDYLTTSGPHQPNSNSNSSISIINNNNNNNTNNNNNSSNINNNNLINTRNTNVRHTTTPTTTANHQHHVSSSAPAAGATFQHASTNGCLTITNGGRGSNSQLIATDHHHHSNNDYEFSNGNGVPVVAASTNAAGAAPTNGRTNSANQLLLHNGAGSGSGSNSSHHMIIDDHHSHIGAYGGSGGSNSNHSPPRGHTTATGGHYMQLSGATAGGQSGTSTPAIGASGRRRTISSNSNGAGTREVHNKLEKNRRAHLKECYEALKNELPLRDEDRKKTSNLAILGEANRHVLTLKRQDKDLEAKMEQLAKEKINLQKRIVSLKRELGPRCDQIFAGIFPDSELGIIPSERDNLNDNASLSSGRGSMLYSSSSSLSSNSGGSNGNTMSSPIGAGMQTAMPTAISPVISKTNSNSTCVQATTTTTSPISPNMLQHMKISTGSAKTSPTGSPTTPINGVINVSLSSGSSMPLTLAAKNAATITTLTRAGSPTPSTPSPSPSSSGVSSSSSMISSSPPINGVINGRNVTVNIPNGLKFQAAAANNNIGGTTVTTIGNGSATIIATSAPASIGGGGNNSNNAYTPGTAATTAGSNITSSKAAKTRTTSSGAVAAVLNGFGNQRGHSYSRKTSLHYGDGMIAKTAKKNQTTAFVSGTGAIKHYENGENFEDGEQPAKFLKVFNGSTLTETTVARSTKHISGCSTTVPGGAILTAAITSNGGGIGNGQLQLTQVVGGGNLVVSPATAVTVTSSPVFSTTTAAHTTHTQFQKLPGGAELNILPTNGGGNGITIGTKLVNGINPATTATAFYHANGKLALVNGGGAAPTGNGNGAILLKEGAAELGGTANGLTPIIVTSASTANGGTIQYASNLAQLVMATSNGSNGVISVPSEQRVNGKSVNKRSSIAARN